MALVAYGSSGEDSGLEDEEDEAKEEKPQEDPPKHKVHISNDDKDSVREAEKPKRTEVHISDDDEEEEKHSVKEISDIMSEEEDIVGLSSSKSIFSGLLPTAAVSKRSSGVENFVDNNEDLSTIPEAKEYEAPPQVSSLRRRKKKRRGPVRIVLPSLSSLKAEDDTVNEDKAKNKILSERKKLNGSIGAFLPPPKNSVPTSSSIAHPKLVPHSVKKRAAATLIPDSVKKKQKKTKNAVDSDSDSDVEGGGGGGGGSFFSIEDEKKEKIMDSKQSISVIANPGVEEETEKEEDVYGPAAASSYPPLPSTYPDPDDLMANEEALERLAGKHSLKKKEHMNVIDVKSEDLTADPRVWLTKALTEEDADKPGPKVTIKGVQKTRHQITYLAQLAKANEQKLKQEWANNAHNRRMAAQKYGF